VRPLPETERYVIIFPDDTDPLPLWTSDIPQFASFIAVAFYHPGPIRPGWLSTVALSNTEQDYGTSIPRRIWSIDPDPIDGWMDPAVPIFASFLDGAQVVDLR